MQYKNDITEAGLISYYNLPTEERKIEKRMRRSLGDRAISLMRWVRGS